MKKKINEDDSNLDSDKEIFKNLKSLAYEAALSRVKQAKTELESKIELAILKNEAKLLYESCLDFGNKILKIENFSTFEEVDFPEENQDYEKVEKEFDEAKDTLMDQLKLKESLVKDCQNIREQLEEANEKSKQNEKDQLKIQENLRNIENLSRKMDKRNKSLQLKLEKIRIKDAFIEKIRIEQSNDETINNCFDSVPEEQEKISELKKKLDQLEAEREKILEANKNLVFESQELKSLILCFPSFDQEKRKLEEKEDHLSTLNLTNKNLLNSLKKIKEKQSKIHKELEISLMKLADVKTEINLKAKQKSQKAVQISSLQSFSALILTEESLPKFKSSKQGLLKLQQKTFDQISSWNSSTEKLLQNLFDSKKETIERKIREELGSWLMKKTC